MIDRLRPRSPASASAFIAGTLASCFLLVACQSTSGGEDEAQSVGWLVAHERYEEAVRLAAQNREARPGDRAAEEDHRQASVAWLLEQGRRLRLANEDEASLEQFRQALAISPDDPIVQDWIDVQLDKLAAMWMERAIEWHAQDNLEQAAECYEKALTFRPESARAKEGLARALLQLNYRSGMGERYYEQGIRSMHDSFLEQARWGFSASRKYEPENERAHRRETETRTLLADQRAALALDLEDRAQFAAARNEFRLALLLDPDRVEAQEGLARTHREEQAADALRKADRLARQKDFEGARAALEEGRGFTERQGEAFVAAADAIESARLKVIYDQARALESDYRFEEATAAYANLLEQAPFFGDAIARMETLQSYMSKADELYTQAMSAATDEEQAALLRQIRIFWPEYKDVRQRLEAIEGPEGPPVDPSDAPSGDGR